MVVAQPSRISTPLLKKFLQNRRVISVIKKISSLCLIKDNTCVSGGHVCRMCRMSNLVQFFSLFFLLKSFLFRYIREGIDVSLSDLSAKAERCLAIRYLREGREISLYPISPRRQGNIPLSDISAARRKHVLLSDISAKAGKCPAIRYLRGEKETCLVIIYLRGVRTCIFFLGIYKNDLNKKKREKKLYYQVTHHSYIHNHNVCHSESVRCYPARS